ncbi:hypothetical protein PV377_21145 [Streptomyces ipomoeae]|uniref:hypothetical protein n=1 Tax=Streptomyces ipomoeae TaxID=103232 RepID=UPI0029AD1D98|nr:hypothetical protein [Streptomyces ipomoeae]MDX2841447.1 hypothetical protein [Streptomyces ipomoeae]
MNTVFVAMIGDIPTAAAPTLEAVQENVLKAETAWASSSNYDYRWDEYHPGKVWRLMQRRKGEAGKGRRFSWTQRSVHTVDFVTEGGAR